MKRLFLLPALLGIFLLPPRDAAAQVHFGPQIALYEFEDFGIGGRIDFGLGNAFGITDATWRHIYGSGNISYIFNDSDATSLSFNMNVALPFQTSGSVTPFAGAGLNHWRTSYRGHTGTSSGLNLLGGIHFSIGTVPSYTELQYSTSGDGYITLALGLRFGG